MWWVDWLWFFMVMSVLVGGWWLIRRSLLQNPACPNCGAKKTKEHERDVVETKTIELPNGQDGGVMLRTIWKVRYHCPVCDHRWWGRDAT